MSAIRIHSDDNIAMSLQDPSASSNSVSLSRLKNYSRTFAKSDTGCVIFRTVIDNNNFCLRKTVKWDLF
jgi:hypothetical protein